MIGPIDYSRFADGAQRPARLGRPRHRRDLLRHRVAHRPRVASGAREAQGDAAAHAPAGRRRAHRVLAGARCSCWPSAAPSISSAAASPLFIDIAIPLLIALAIIRMLLYAMRRLFARQAWLKTSERAIAFTIWVLVVLYFIGVLPEIARELDAHRAADRQVVGVDPDDRRRASRRWSLTLVVTLWLSSLLEQRVLDATSFDTNTKALLSKLLRAVLLVVGVLIALRGDRLRPHAAHRVRRRAGRRHRARPAEARRQLHRRLHDPARASRSGWAT